jgi:hypothetical protein
MELLALVALLLRDDPLVVAASLAVLTPAEAFDNANSEKSLRTRAAPAAVKVGPCKVRFAASFLLNPDAS